MIRLTLYKGCRLNDSYKNVISQYQSSPVARSPLEDYLVALHPKIIELDTVYQEDSTTFNFTLTETDYTSIYEYNYMKIESFIENSLTLTRYAFINSIRICNDIGVIDYKIDVWHSFSKYIIGLNKSYLKGLRVINGRGGLLIPSYYNLPIDYAGNNEISIEPINTIKSNEDNFMLIVEIQYYNGTSYGESTQVYTSYVLIKNSVMFDDESEATVSFGNRSDFKFKNINRILEQLITLKTEKNYYSAPVNDATAPGGNPTPSQFRGYLKYYKIGNIYVLPYNSTIANKFNYQYTNAIFHTDADDVSRGLGYEINYLERNNSITNQYELFSMLTGTLSNDFKLEGLGLVSSYFKINMNGSSIDYSIKCQLGVSSFKLYLSIENKLIDITDSFLYKPIVNQLDGEALAQQSIARELQNRNNTLNLASSVINGGKQITESKLENYENRHRFSYFANSEVNSTMGLISSMAGMANANLGIANAVVNTGLSLIQYSIKRENINAPVYSSADIVLSNNIAILNARYMLCKFKIVSDNDNYVKESINNLGYNVYEYIDDISKIGLNISPNTMSEIHYNCIQFGVADVYGNFPLNIKNSLDTILMNGIKFWYYPNFSSDTYIVG